MNNIKRIHINEKGMTIKRIVITAIAAAIYFYFKLPALNFKNPGFYVYILLIIAFYGWLSMRDSKGGPVKINGVYIFSSFAGGTESAQTIDLKKLKPYLIACAVPLCVLVAGWIISAPIFNAQKYSNLLTTEDGDFASEIEEISFDQIPMLDSTSANTLSNRKLGELSDLVSQFTVNGESFQINYRGKPVRVTYLNYGSFFKWANNVQEGIPAYMMVDMVTQEVTVVRTEDGIHYSPSEYFFRNLDRYLRIKYPTYMFSDVNLEIDDYDNPWWVASVVDKTIGLFGGEDCKGAVLLNAVTGETFFYSIDEVPQWVDRVYSDELIIEQYDYYGLYHNGFFNSLFAQTGCVMTTDGYNYIALDDDVWVYTGVTSVSSDESNIGFILVNQRTKEARFYAIAGAEEYSAASSAEGAVQQYEYQSTFPLLLNISGQPTYFMALKDDSSLVKMYAMVNVQQYQIVAVGTTVEDCKLAYFNQLEQNKIEYNTSQSDAAETETVEGIIEDIRFAVISGNTVAYIKLDNGNYYYSVKVLDCESVIIVNIGDKVQIEYEKWNSDGNIIPAKYVTILKGV